MSEIFFIGCTHFDHARIIDIAHRPFADVDAMNEALIERWNNTVTDRDTVYHLGDFGWRAQSPDFLGRLRGQIIRLQGNHDASGWGWPYREIEGPGGLKICLFHYPIDDWNGRFNGSVHFHAHTHKHDFVSKPGRGNVSAEAINYTPIELTEALRRLTDPRDL